MTDFPQYDELHVVSDLHMGGRPGFQILKEGKRLANFIHWVGEQRPGKRVGLVLNGDIIDSLAEDIGGYVAADEAVAMVTRIFTDLTFAPVWEALHDFVAKDGRSLILIIGNHDIELALPAVQRAIEARLAGDEVAKRGRIVFSTAGAGYTCLVGTARIFCIHGNEEDSWNVVDYDALSLLARSQNAGLPFDPCKWQPNAGTRLVKDVMNEVKRTFAWIDLLKPEKQAAISVLAVLDPGQIIKLARGIPILWEKLRGTLKVNGLLSANETSVVDASATQDIVLDALLGPNLRDGLRGVRTGASVSAEAMLREAEETFDKPRASDPCSDEMLGWPQLVWDRLTGIEKPEALRRALLDWLRDDRTFDITDRDETFKKVTAKVGSGVDFVITGHTHLERAIEIDARRCYFNCGTWIRLLHFTDEMLNHSASPIFRRIYDVLMDGSMTAIDASVKELETPFMLDQTSAVCIRADGAGAIGELVHIQDGRKDTIRRQLVKEFRR